MCWMFTTHSTRDRSVLVHLLGSSWWILVSSVILYQIKLTARSTRRQHLTKNTMKEVSYLFKDTWSNIFRIFCQPFLSFRIRCFSLYRHSLTSDMIWSFSVGKWLCSGKDRHSQMGGLHVVKDRNVTATKWLWQAGGLSNWCWYICFPCIGWNMPQ